MFFEVNNEVETRREEPGYEVGQNRLVLLFGPFLRLFRKAEKSLFRFYKAFLAWSELHWTSISRGH